MPKESSTSRMNEQFLFRVCDLDPALALISGRRTAQIVYSIPEGNSRFHLLKKALPHISQQVLGRALKAPVPTLDSLFDWSKVYASGKAMQCCPEAVTTAI